VTPNSLLGGNRAEYAQIRKKWNIPHDGLRHTSISACTSLHGFTEATLRHGNSEKIIRDHYLDRYDVDETQAFYSILPMKVAAPAPSKSAETVTAVGSAD
jgi:hypothetical protein